jgi:UDP-2,3-diacylglucosamine hydrolase
VSAAGTPATPPPALAADTDQVRLDDALLISDLHLSASQPATLARFLRFVDEDAARHRALLVLGDLFEFWVGDDADDAIGVVVADALRSLAGRGVGVFVMHGNRDLLLGRRFCALAGARMLADPTLADLGGTGTLLAHGDAYCTRDADYMAFRARVRDPAFQQAFLGKALAERRTFVGQARAASEAGKQAKSMQIMDVTPDEIDAALLAAGVARMIHGHTHRPATHRFALDGRAAERWVLPDWDFDAEPARGGYLHADGAQLRVHALGG